MIQKDEIRLTNDVIDILEWNLRKSDELGVNIYYREFSPILINKCNVCNITTMFSHGRDERILYFRPMKNGKHCQFLIDYLYDNEEELDQILTSKDKDTKMYSGRIVMMDGTEYKLDNFHTETELKFALFYLYYNGKDESKTIKRIHDADEKFKKDHPDKPNKRKSRK